MAKVLFINPLVREEDDPKHVPYGIALLAALAIEEDHQVQVYDENAWRQGAEVLREVLLADEWDVVALGGITTTYGSVKEIVGHARELRPTALIVLGGGLLTAMPREMMTWLHQVDIGVIGEAFVTFNEILDRFDNQNVNWGDVDGLIYRTERGELKLSSSRALIEDLDVLPYPAWDLFPLEEVYFPNSQNLKSAEGMLATRRLDINASYGCSLICRFCFHLGIAGDMRRVINENGDDDVEFDVPGNYTRTIRYHSPEYIVGMVKHAYDKYNINFINFLDENLMTMDRYSGQVWLKEICRLWHEYGLAPEINDDANGGEFVEGGIYWAGTSHATLCNQEILKTMRAAGCSYLIYGYESFAPHVLKELGKGSTVKTNIRSFFWTLEAGIRPMPNQIIGFPNDDFESLRLNMKAWQELGIVVKPFFATAYPGSEWFNVYRKRIIDQYGGDLEKFILDLGDATKITGVISENFSAVELLGLREAMMNFDHKSIDQHEANWRENHQIPEGMPSTLLQDRRPVSKVA